MLTISDGTLSSAMKRWEDARDSLANALTGYLTSCTLLEATLYPGPGRTNAMYITSRIDSTLDSFQRDMTQRLVQSTSTLARARNRLVSPILCLPENILFDIFLHIVYAPESKNLPMKNCLRAMYSNLHNLVAVCSAWRNLAMNQGVLWETIPLCDPSIKHRAIDLSIQRAGDRDLRFAIILPKIRGWAPQYLVGIVKKHAPRLRALNLEGEYLSTIIDLVSEMLSDGAPSQLSELSIRYTPTWYSSSEETTPWVLNSKSPDQVTFTRLTESLSVLRLSWAQIEWGKASFSGRLVELFVHKVKLGDSESALITFLSAISSALDLRDLKILDVKADRNPAETIHLTKPPKVVFPKLQSLLLHDLSSNVLEILLLAIAPGSYHSTLGLTRKGVRVDDPNHTAETDKLDNLITLLKLVKIDKLVLIGDPSLIGPWLDGPEIRKLLESMPNLKELGMNGWVFDADFYTGLILPPISGTGHGEFVFPRLESLELTQAEIVDEAQFRSVLSNISTRELVLGGYIGKEEDCTELKGDEEIVDWVKRSVPYFRLVHSKYPSAGVKALEWPLW